MPSLNSYLSLWSNKKNKKITIKLVFREIICFFQHFNSHMNLHTFFGGQKPKLAACARTLLFICTNCSFTLNTLAIKMGLNIYTIIHLFQNIYIYKCWSHPIAMMLREYLRWMRCSHAAYTQHLIDVRRDTIVCLCVCVMDRAVLSSICVNIYLFLMVKTRWINKTHTSCCVIDVRFTLASARASCAVTDYC